MSRIRSNRGRSAAWRSIWTWPLRSTTHLAATVLLAASAVLLVGQATPATDDPPPPPHPPAARPAPPPPAPQADTPAVLELLPAPTMPVAHTGTPADQLALRNAVGFATAFVNHPPGVANDRWRARMQPYAQPELLTRLSLTDPATVPATRLAGAPHVLAADEAITTLVQPTDTIPLRLTVIRPDGDVWRVARIEHASGSG